VHIGGPAAGPPHAQATDQTHPPVVVAVQVVQAMAAELGGRFQHDVDLGGASDRDDAAQKDHPLRIAGESEGFATLDDPALGDPPGAPDQARVMTPPT
jgi:hypothetical protein